MKCKKTAIVGSFDPFHEGHLFLLKKALRNFKEVVIVMSINPHKDSNDLEHRYNQIKSYLNDLNIDVQIIKNYGLTVDCLEMLGCSYLIRGIRNLEDFKYELKMKKINKILNSNIKTRIYFNLIK